MSAVHSGRYDLASQTAHSRLRRKGKSTTVPVAQPSNLTWYILGFTEGWGCVYA